MYYIVNNISKAPKFLKLHLVNKNKVKIESFNECKSRWSKEPQWTNDCGSFFTMFSTSELSGYFSKGYKR